MELGWTDLVAILTPIIGVVVYLNKSLEKKMDLKFIAIDHKFSQKFEAVDQKFSQKLEAVDQKIEAMDQKFSQKFKGIDQKLTEMKEEMREMRTDIKSIDQRMTRLEGRFDERGYWESRMRTGTDDA